MVGPEVQIHGRVTGRADGPSRRHEAGGGTGRPDVEHLAPGVEISPDEAAQENQQGAMAGLRSAARAEPGPPLLAVAPKPRPAPTGQTLTPGPSVAPGIVRDGLAYAPTPFGQPRRARRRKTRSRGEGSPTLGERFAAVHGGGAPRHGACVLARWPSSPCRCWADRPGGGVDGEYRATDGRSGHSCVESAGSHSRTGTRTPPHRDGRRPVCDRVLRVQSRWRVWTSACRRRRPLCRWTASLAKRMPCSTRSTALGRAFKAGRRLRVQLRFWPE